MSQPITKLDFELYERYHQGAQPLRHLPDRRSYTYARILQTVDAVVNQRKNLRVLDYGCGVGTIALYLAKLGHQVLGVDISPTSIRAAQQAAQRFMLTKQVDFKTFRSAKVLFRQLRPASFDLIVCSEVVEHVPDDQQLMADLHQLLKPNGQLILTTRSSHSWPFRLGWLNQHEKIAGHLRRYSDASLTKLWRATGWRLVSLQKVDSALRELIYGYSTAGQLVRILRGPIATIALWLERPLIQLFGYGGYIVVLQRRQLLAQQPRKLS